MGANYQQPNQGKRDDQLEFSYMMIGLSLLGSLILIIGFSIYHILSYLIY